MKLCSFGYIPPPGVGFPDTFLKNIRRFKRACDLVLYSDYPWPDTIRLKGSPDAFKGTTFPDGRPNRFAVPNAAFFTGLRICKQHGYTHVLALECDCRVAVDHWDLQVFEEFFDLGKPCIAAGSLATYNPCNWSPTATARWQQLIQRNSQRNFPVATYGFLGAGVKGGTCVFPNGALAVYDLNWLSRAFDLEQTTKLAQAATAWDMEIGARLWNTFGEEAYDHVGFLETIWSGYGEIVTTEAERKAMLTSGKIVAVHQIKTDWLP